MTTIDVDPPPPAASGRTRHPALGRGVPAGLLAAGLALGVGELVAGTSSRFDSPVIVVGDLVVDNVPRPVKDLAIEWFGTNDKKALLIGILVIVAIIGAVTGALSLRRRRVGTAVFAAFGVLGVVAAYQAVDATDLAFLPATAGALAGAGALALLLRPAPSPEADRTAPAGPAAPADGAEGAGGPGRIGELSAGLRRTRAGGDPAGPGGLARRSFLAACGLTLGAAAASASVGRWLQGRVSATASRLAVVLPGATTPAAAVPAGVAVAGADPFITPNDDFYRIDTALVVPQVQADTWTLRIHGMVERELELTFDQLLARDLIEEHITLACVSNTVGGDLVGTALWLGAPLAALLEEAGVDPAADQLVGRSVDDFTAGFPLAALADGRPAMVAVGMNGEPLPLRHGFPARLIVPGLYGYVSATKWLTEIEVTRFDAFDPYWIRRGWSVEGPIKLMSRIDTPGGLARVAPGPVPVAGVAWAPTVGISAVEVRVDEGPWMPAQLAEQLNELTWRQWVYTWDATPGRHLLTVRAVDADGRPQVEERTEPFPSGATGLHNVLVRVSDA